jgi:hypothetical protein
MCLFRKGRSTLRPYTPTSGIKSRTFLQRNFTPNQRPEPSRPSRLMKPRRPINPVAIAKRQRRVAKAHSFGDKVFGLRSAFEKTESRGGMEFEVHEASQLDITFELLILCQS